MPAEKKLSRCRGICKACGCQPRVPLEAWSGDERPRCKRCGEKLTPSQAVLRTLGFTQKEETFDRQVRCRKCNAKLRTANNTGWCAICQQKVLKGVLGNEDDRMKLIAQTLSGRRARSA